MKTLIKVLIALILLTILTKLTGCGDESAECEADWARWNDYNKQIAAAHVVQSQLAVQISATSDSDLKAQLTGQLNTSLSNEGDVNREKEELRAKSKCDLK